MITGTKLRYFMLIIGLTSLDWQADKDWQAREILLIFYHYHTLGFLYIRQSYIYALKYTENFFKNTLKYI